MTHSKLSPLVEARDLVLEYETKGGRVRSLDSASLRVMPGDLTALVGESGSGKSTLGLAIGRLLASNSRRISGSLTVDGMDVFEASDQTLRLLRRETLAFIFQNPVASLDPTMRIRKQMMLAGPTGLVEPVEVSLEQVGLRDIPRVLRSFPYQLSGGMAQRVAIAMALRRRPKLLIADEPTAAVDATLRAQILELLVDRCREQQTALLLMTHDLHAVATHTSHVAVMYGGRVVESGHTVSVMAAPAHPYTSALLSALPGEERLGQRLEAIKGVPPTLRAESVGCAFASRCPLAFDACRQVRPVLGATSSGDRRAACHLVSGPLANVDLDTMPGVRS